MLRNVDWRKPFFALVSATEKRMCIRVHVDEAVLLDAVNRAEESLDALGFQQPNVAKIAGCLVFWLSWLKPLSISERSPNYFDAVNEHVAVRLGITLCRTCADDTTRAGKISLQPRIIKEWTMSLRYHQNSPHGLMTTFEILACI